MTQDRFSKMVEQRAYDELYIPTREAAWLLRREHRRVVRLVKGRFASMCKAAREAGHDDTPFVAAQQEILAALARDVKGGT